MWEDVVAKYWRSPIWMMPVLEVCGLPWKLKEHELLFFRLPERLN